MQSLTLPASVSKRKQACRSCRQRKKKCDGGRPSCGLCKKWNVRCEYTVPASIGAEDDSSSLATMSGTLIGYMRPPAAPLDSWDAAFNIPFPGLDPSAFDTIRIGNTFNAEYPTPISNVDPLSTSSGDSDMLAISQPTLPPHEELLELVEMFFDKVYSVIPCFHKASFMSELQEGRIQEQSPLVLYAMLSVTAMFHPDPTVKARRTDWYEQAKFLYDMTGRDPHPALRTLQGVLFLIYHAYTSGDFSACWLYIGKAWRQAATINMGRMDSDQTFPSPIITKHGIDLERHGYYGRVEWEASTRIEKEECRRTLWVLFMMDRNQSWPTAWPNAIDERQFKIDIPIAEPVFQALTAEKNLDELANTPYAPSLDTLLASITAANNPLNMFHYLVVAYVLLGRTADLVHSIHDDPNSPEYAEKCAQLDTHLVKFRLSLPRAATSVIEAAERDRGQVVWLHAILNTVSLLLHYRAVPLADSETIDQLFAKSVMAAKNTSQVVKDAARTSIDLLLNAHVAPSLYIACCVLIIHHRLDNDASLKNDIDFVNLVFERMNDIFTVLGLKFMLALKRDMARDREELLALRERGYRGLLADCTKWGFVKYEMSKLGLTMS